MQETLFVNEDGMYDVILESRKDNAKKFRKWVTAEVLPSIRKHGIFGAVRTVEVEGKTYFVASDVAKALGYSIPHKAVQTHCKGVLKRNIPTSGGNQEMV